MPERPRLALDLVGILEDSWPAKRSYLKRIFRLDVGGVPLADALLKTRLGLDSAIFERVQTAMNRFVHAAARICKHPVIPGAQDSLPQVLAKYDVYILTSRRDNKRTETEHWLRANGFDALATERLIMRCSRTSTYNGCVSKLAWCEAHSFHCIVDDDCENLEPTPVHVIRRVLFTRESPVPLCPNVEATHSWPELIHVLGVRSTSRTVEKP
jgi:hypothetical protein